MCFTFLYKNKNCSHLRIVTVKKIVVTRWTDNTFGNIISYTVGKDYIDTVQRWCKCKIKCILSIYRKVLYSTISQWVLCIIFSLLKKNYLYVLFFTLCLWPSRTMGWVSIVRKKQQFPKTDIVGPFSFIINAS